MRKLFMGISGVLAAIPGLAIILKGIATPPQYQYLFGGVIQTLGGISIIVLLVNKAKIRRLSVRKVSKIIILLTIVGFGSLVLYISLFKLCVVSHSAHGTVYYPLWTNGRLAELIGRTGGRWEALDRYGQTPVQNAISQVPSYVMAITTGLLLLVYQAIFTSWTIAFGLAGFRQERTL